MHLHSVFMPITSVNSIGVRLLHFHAIHAEKSGVDFLQRSHFRVRFLYLSITNQQITNYNL